MNSGLLNSWISDLKASWGIWNKISVASSTCWLLFIVFVAISHTEPRSGVFAISIGFLFVSIVTGFLAIAKRTASMFAVLLLAILSIILGFPIVMLILIWVPELVREHFFVRDGIPSVGYFPLFVIFWLVFGAIAAGCFILVRRSNKNQSGVKR